VRGSEGGEFIDGDGLNQIHHVISLAEMTWAIGRRVMVRVLAVDFRRHVGILGRPNM